MAPSQEYKKETVDDFLDKYVSHKFALASNRNQDASLVMLASQDQILCDGLTAITMGSGHTQLWRELEGHNMQANLYAFLISVGGEESAEPLKQELLKYAQDSRCDYLVFNGATANPEANPAYDAKQDSRTVFEELLKRLAEQQQS